MRAWIACVLLVACGHNKTPNDLLIDAIYAAIVISTQPQPAGPSDADRRAAERAQREDEARAMVAGSSEEARRLGGQVADAANRGDCDTVRKLEGAVDDADSAIHDLLYREPKVHACVAGN